MLKLITNISIASLVLFNTYKSYKARTLYKGLRRQYSRYFKVMSLFLVFDNVFSTFLRFIPFYQVGRLLIVMWPSIPTCSGAAFVYRFYINGFLKVYEQDLYQYMVTLKEKILNKFFHYYNYANNKYKEARNRKKIQDTTEDKQNPADSLLDDQSLDIQKLNSKIETPEMGLRSFEPEKSKNQGEIEDPNSSVDELSAVSNEEENIEIK